MDPELTEQRQQKRQQEQAEPVAEPGGQPPRKRRRRTAAGGAADDCFACRRRAVKCDRKRPYCTQCIDIGKECSGYKTTLTWGVGVASRGKLRGMSFPIANKPPGPADASSAPPPAQRSRKVSTSVIKLEDPGADNLKASAAVAQSPELQTRPPAVQDTLRSPATATPFPQFQCEWHPPRYQRFQHHAHMNVANEAGDTFGNQTNLLRRLQTALPLQYDGGSTSSAVSAATPYAESVYHTPFEYPRTPRDMPQMDPYSRSLPIPFSEGPMGSGSPSGLAITGHQMVPYHHMSSSVDSAHGGLAFSPLAPSVHAAPSSGRDMLGSLEPGVLEYAALESTLAQLGDDDDNDNDDMIVESEGMSLLDTRFAGPFFHIAPRLQSLMEHYSRHICPFIVALDGPENPYRKHILQLAMQNNGLQNAIAALSTNNIRMRHKATRAIGSVHEMADDYDDASEPTQEESFYKQMSIDQLNMQLTDSRAAQDDSVLATLLILCLFHVSDSGFSKFKTQLAGVQKLLALRQIQSDFTRWVEMFFVWFDVMTSAVNDREMQVTRESLAMLDYSANLGALEQYSGIDGLLFKQIARLGRLNLLAQGRQVRGQSRSSSPPPPPPTDSRPAAVKPPRRPEPSWSGSLRAADYEHVDGNGWGSPIVAVDEEHDAHGHPIFDDRHEFWAEWHDIRTRLQSWTMASDGDSGAASVDQQQRDMRHINESFRYSALLYTERLGHPVQTSSAEQFQFLVSQALFHITALPISSCVNKFLLWPLFITGTECVDPGHRGIVRLRCRAIMAESGFYNNLSSLEVLERVWGEADANTRGSEGAEVRARRRESTSSPTRRYGQAFRWRKAMDRVDGEYIVI